MVVLRALCVGSLSAVISFALFNAAGCGGTDAVGVEECRDIETARCEAAVHCGIIDDVDACKRYYDSHCLHGMSLSNAPSANKVTDCVRMLEGAAECAEGKDGNAPIESASACGHTDQTSEDTVCDTIRFPEETIECRFLIPEEPEIEIPDAGPDAADSGGTDAASDAGGDAGDAAG